MLDRLGGVQRNMTNGGNPFLHRLERKLTEDYNQTVTIKNQDVSGFPTGIKTLPIFIPKQLLGGRRIRLKP